MLERYRTLRLIGTHCGTWVEISAGQQEPVGQDTTYRQHAVEHHAADAGKWN